MKTLVLVIVSMFTLTAFADWNYATPVASPITNTTPVAIVAANSALKTTVKSFQIFNSHATVGSVVTLRNGTTVLWTGYSPANGVHPIVVNLDVPLIGSTNTALNFVVETTGANVFISAQGSQSR